MFSEFSFFFESSVCMLLLIATYKLILQNDTNFQINRFFLLFSLTISIIIPFVELQTQVLPALYNYNHAINEIIIFSDSTKITNINSFSVFNIVLWFYFAGIGLFSIRLINSIIRIGILIKRNEIRKLSGYKLVIMDEQNGSFNFFNYIFIDRESFESEQSDQIIAHELSHSKNYHSLDLLYLELIIITQWFNPFLRLYKKSLIEVHEYQADDDVLSKGYSLSIYQLTLVNQLLLSNNLFYANKLNNSIIQLRFKMMKRIKSSGISTIKAIIIIPITFIMMFAFSCGKQNSNFEYDTARYTNIERSNIIPDKFPEFQGGYKALYEYVNRNFKIPDELKGKDINGKIHVGFIVEPDGSISNVHIINAKLITNDNYVFKFGYGCDEEAIRVFRSMPKWSPAVKDGKSIAMVQFHPIIIGDKEKVYKDESANSVTFPAESGSNRLSDDTELPKFVAENGNISAFINKNIKYPEEARLKNISGKVILSFVVNEKGETENIQVVQAVGGGCTEEAIRIVKLFPKWKPAESEGKIVSVTQTLPFVFKLK